MRWVGLGLIGLAAVAAIGAGCAPGGHRCALWVDVYRGEPVEQAAMVDELADADVVYLGERHRVGRHHRLQREIVEGLAARDVAMVLGLEMLWHTHQPTLDRYNAGEITFDELAAEIEWADVWANYVDYRPIIEAAHAAGAPIIALNAPDPAVKAVFRSGLAKMDAELRAQLPETLHLDDPMYEQHLAQVMMVHAHVDEQMMRRMFTAQVARDETMAARLVEYLRSPVGAGRTTVVLCGSGHCAHGMGIPQRVTWRWPEARQRIIVMSESGDVDLSPAMMKMVREVEITHEDLRILTTPIADYLHVIERRPDDIE